MNCNDIFSALYRGNHGQSLVSGQHLTWRDAEHKQGICDAHNGFWSDVHGVEDLFEGNTHLVSASHRVRLRKQKLKMRPSFFDFFISLFFDIFDDLI